MSKNIKPLLESDFATDFAKDSFKVVANMILDMEAKNFNFTNLDKIFTIASGLALVLSSKIIGRSANPAMIPRVMGITIGALIGGQVTKALPTFKGSVPDMKLSTLKFIAGLIVGPMFKILISIVGKILSTLLKPFISMPHAKNMMGTQTGSKYNGKLTASFYVHIILGFGIGALGMWMYAKKHGVSLIKYKSEENPTTQASKIIDKLITENEGGKSPSMNFFKNMKPVKEFKKIVKSMIGNTPADELKGFTSSKIKAATINNAGTGKSTSISSVEEMILRLIRNSWGIANDASKGELTKLCTRDVRFINKTTERIDVIGIMPDGSIIIAVNPNNTALQDINERELAAILLHELGHYASKHFTHTMATVIPLSLLQFVPDVMSGPESIFLRGAISYYDGALGKFHEIQADKYAIERGFGQELATALRALIGKYIEKHNYDNYEVHGNTKLRIEAILAESAKYDRFK